MLTAPERRQVELIFRQVDEGCKGVLPKASNVSIVPQMPHRSLVAAKTCSPSASMPMQAVLERLAARLNPDICFSPFQLSVIADEVRFPRACASDRAC